MRQVAIVNGTEVYSDKEMAGITNSRITFTDGSWCDVRTGEVVNRGAGAISLGSRPSAEAAGPTETVGPHTHPGHSVTLTNLNADVTVTPRKRPAADQDDAATVEVTIAGPKHLVEKIRTQAHGGMVTITGPNDRARGGGGIHINGGDVVIGRGSVMSSVFQRGGRVVTHISGGSGGGSDPADVKITVVLPFGGGVTLDNLNGTAQIGDTHGAVAAEIRGDARITAGRIAGLRTQIVGGGQITVASVDGPVQATISGSGDVRVNGGNTDALVATVTGSGDIRVRTVG